jgi:hypothetical protein
MPSATTQNVMALLVGRRRIPVIGGAGFMGGQTGLVFAWAA